MTDSVVVTETFIKQPLQNKHFSNTNAAERLSPNSLLETLELRLQQAGKSKNAWESRADKYY